MPAPSKPSLKPKEDVDLLDTGDTVYVRHPELGVAIVTVRAVGKDGFQADGEDGKRHRIHHGNYLGHKSRLTHQYEMIDAGRDGIVVQREDGKRRFLGSPKMVKALEPDPVIEAPADPLLELLLGLTTKAMAPVADSSSWIAKATGPMLRFNPTKQKKAKPKKPSADKNTPPGGPHKAGPEAKGEPLHKHGDLVRFRHGDVIGCGIIVASGIDGVTVQTEDGREHMVRHDALLPPTDEDKQARAEAENAKQKPAGKPSRAKPTKKGADA